MAASRIDFSSNDRPLAQEITTATRSVHATLNRQIVARLPLALPPQAADPTAYVSGLLHIAPIYIAFESLWRDIVELPPSELVVRDIANDNDDAAADAASSTGSTPAAGDCDGNHSAHSIQVCSRIQAMLGHLYLPDLMRTGRLKEDIMTLSGWPIDVVDEQLEAIAKTGRLREFVSHIRRAVQQKPHILMAYSYIMFMALFAGGRFIRASLESAGDEFWGTIPSISTLPLAPPQDKRQQHEHSLEHDSSAEPGSRRSDRCDRSHHRNVGNALHDSPFCFFHFSTPNDGEDLKLEFKSRLSEAEGKLTARERREIVQEAVCIFDNMRLLVQQLDELCATADHEEMEHDDLIGSLGHLLKNPLGTRFRDSVAVTKERAARSSSKWSSSSDDTEKNASGGPWIPFISSNHPLIPAGSDLKSCPASAKSMRFETTPRTLRVRKSSENLRVNFASGARAAARGAYGIGLTNLLVAFAFAAVFACALLSRRGVLEPGSVDVDH